MKGMSVPFWTIRIEGRPQIAAMIIDPCASVAIAGAVIGAGVTLRAAPSRGSYPP
jgi:hypothetical protein